MSRATFSAVLEPSPTGWGVTFPNFPGCVSFGRTRREAQENATDALELHIAGMMEDGETVPFEGDDEDWIMHASDGVSGDRYPVFITVDMVKAGSERVNVYLPKALLAQIDRFVAGSGMNRSSFFGVAARKYLVSESKDPFEVGPMLREFAEERFDGSLPKAAKALLTDAELEEHFRRVNNIPLQERPRFVAALRAAEASGMAAA